MKLLFYISTIAGGGAARVMTNLANVLSAKGHDCVLITTFVSEEEYTLEDSVHRVSLFEKKPIDNWLRKNCRITYRLRKYVKELQPDILISFLGEPNFRSVLSTIGTKTKTVLSVRNDPNWEYKGIIPKLFAKYLFRRADGMVFQTADAQAWFPKCIQQKSRIIFNAVKEEFYNVELPDTKSGIVATGRLTMQKNHKMLIQAYANIADKVADDLTIYGAGDSSALLHLANEYGVADRVHLPGQVSDVKNAIKGARLYVMSSDFEGMPNALMEAMAIGLPCISTDCPCGGPKSLFTEDMFHFLTPVGDATTFADRMLELCQDEQTRSEHALKCKAAADAFRPERINKEWEDYLFSIIDY